MVDFVPGQMGADILGQERGGGLAQLIGIADKDDIAVREAG